MSRSIVLVLAACLIAFGCAAVEPAVAPLPAAPANDPLDDRSTLPPGQSYRPSVNAYVVAVREGQGIGEVRRAATQVLGEEAGVTRLFEEVDEKDDPEGLARLYRVVAPGALDAGTQWDRTYQLRDAGGFEQVEPDTETAIEDARKGQAATVGCLLDQGVPVPGDAGWSHRQMAVPEARTLRPGPAGLALGEGVRVCHPDSGWTVHDELDRDRIDTAASLNLMEGGTDASDPLGYSGHPGHGTATGSVIVSSGGFDANGKVVPPGEVNGLAPKATLVPIRAFNSVIHVFDSDIAKAVQHASRAKCDVVSMSLGGAGFFGLRRAIRDAVRRDIIVVSAAGNCAGIVVAPASYEEVIAVAATNEAKRPWPGSSQGGAIHIAAPGEDVWVARAVEGVSPGKKVEPGDGTSFATAAVAGAAANWIAFHGRDAIKAAQGTQTRQQLFKLALTASAVPGPDWNRRRMGAGILNLRKLLEQPLPSTAGLLVVPPRSDVVTELGKRFDLPRPVVEQGLRRLLRQPDDFKGRLDDFGAEIIDIATRDPDAFRAAMAPPPPGALMAPSMLLPEQGSSRLREAITP